MVDHDVLARRSARHTVVSGTEHVTFDGREEPTLIRRDSRVGPRPLRRVRDRVAHRIRRGLPGPARVKAPVAAQAVHHARPFERVPVVHRAVHGTLSFEDLPVGARPQNSARLSTQRRHRLEHVDGQHGADPVTLDVVPRVEQMDRAVDVTKRAGIYGEPLPGSQVDAGVPEGTQGPVGHGHAETVALVPEAHGVVHPPAAVLRDHLWRPVVRAGLGRQRLERAADRLPAHQVVGHQQLEHSAVDDATGAVCDVCRSGVRFRRQDERIGEVPLVHRIAVRDRHSAILRDDLRAAQQETSSQKEKRMDATRGGSLLPVLMLDAAAQRYVVEGASQAGLGADAHGASDSRNARASHSLRTERLHLPRRDRRSSGCPEPQLGGPAPRGLHGALRGGEVPAGRDGEPGTGTGTTLRSIRSASAVSSSWSPTHG